MKSDKGQMEFLVKPNHISYGASTSWIVILLITASVQRLKRSSEATNIISGKIKHIYKKIHAPKMTLKTKLNLKLLLNCLSKLYYSADKHCNSHSLTEKILKLPLSGIRTLRLFSSCIVVDLKGHS